MAQRFGKLDDLNLGMGLYMSQAQQVPARYASLDGLGEESIVNKVMFSPKIQVLIWGLIVYLAYITIKNSPTRPTWR